jgi:hypothetical protein
MTKPDAVRTRAEGQPGEELPHLVQLPGVLAGQQKVRIGHPRMIRRRLLDLRANSQYQ